MFTKTMTTMMIMMLFIFCKSFLIMHFWFVPSWLGTLLKPGTCQYKLMWYALTVYSCYQNRKYDIYMTFYPEIIVHFLSQHMRLYNLDFWPLDLSHWWHGPAPINFELPEAVRF